MLPLNKQLDIHTSLQESQEDLRVDHPGTLKGRQVIRRSDTNVWGTVAKIGVGIIPLVLIPVYLYQQKTSQNKEFSNSPLLPPQQQPIPTFLNLTVSQPTQEEIEKSRLLNISDNNELEVEKLTLDDTLPLLNIGLCCLIVFLGIKIFNDLFHVQNHNGIEDREVKLPSPPRRSSQSDLNIRDIKDEDLQKRLETISREAKLKLEKIKNEAARKVAEIRDKISSIEKKFEEIKNYKEIKDYSDSQRLYDDYSRLWKPDEIYNFAIICIERINNCSEELEKAYKQITAHAFERLIKDSAVHARKLAIHCIGRKDKASKDILKRSFNQCALSPYLFANTCIQEIQNEKKFPQKILEELLKMSTEHALAFAVACVDTDNYKFITRTTFQEFQAKSLDTAFSYGVACIGKSDNVCRSNIEQASIAFQQTDKQNNFTTHYTLRFAKECATKNAYDVAVGLYNFLREKQFNEAQAFIDWCRENLENSTCTQLNQMHNDFYPKNDPQILALC